ncbi:hypothetical protein [Pigmentiphaga sp. CHJ604]|uniref:hypothetical protein n=1 Tax=Pigmentiphaga sp. CHJ604 TaxID=3081984 RepID=UPI0030D20A8F
MNKATIRYTVTTSSMGGATSQDADRYAAALDAALRDRFPGADVEIRRNDRQSSSSLDMADGVDAGEVEQVAKEVWDRADFWDLETV